MTQRLAWTPLVSMALLLGAWMPISASAQSGFSDAERRRLSRGDLVVRRETRQRGQLRLIGGTAFQVVDQPPEVVWRAVLDTGAYDRFIPQVVEARVLRNQPQRRTVYIEHQHGPVEASYTVRITYNEAARMAEFRLDHTRPHDIREGWGFFRVQAFGEDRSMITFGVMADVGSGLITGLVRPRVHDWMMRIPEQLKEYVEGSGRHRYTD